MRNRESDCTSDRARAPSSAPPWSCSPFEIKIRRLLEKKRRALGPHLHLVLLTWQDVIGCYFNLVTGGRDVSTAGCFVRKMNLESEFGVGECRILSCGWCKLVPLGEGAPVDGVIV